MINNVVLVSGVWQSDSDLEDVWLDLLILTNTITNISFTGHLRMELPDRATA